MKYFAILLIVLLGNQSVAQAQSGGPSGRGSTTGDPAASSENPRAAPSGSVTPERQLQFDLGRSRRQQRPSQGHDAPIATYRLGPRPVSRPFHRHADNKSVTGGPGPPLARACGMDAPPTYQSA